MAIKKFLECMANYSQKLSSKENRFLYDEATSKDTKTEKQEAQKNPETMSEQYFRKKLETDTGIKIGQAEGKKDGKDRVMFKLEDNIPRSFLYNKEEFGKKLRTLLKAGNPNEVKREVYGKLLEISKKDVEKSAESIRKELSGDAAKKLKQGIDVKRVTALNEELAKRIGPISTVGGPGEEKAPQPAAPDKAAIPAPDAKADAAPAPSEAAPENSDAAKAAAKAITATSIGKTAESEGITSVAEGTTASAAAKTLAGEGTTAETDSNAKTKEFPGGKNFKGDIAKNIGKVTYTNAGGKAVVELGQFNQATGNIESGTRTIDGLTSSGKFNKSTALEVGENSIGIGKFDTETGNIVSGKIKNEEAPGKEKIGKFDKTVEGKIIAGKYSDTTPVVCSYTGTFENDMPAKSTVERPEGKYEIVITRADGKPDVTRTGRLTRTNGQIEEGSWDKDFNPIKIAVIKAVATPKAPEKAEDLEKTNKNFIQKLYTELKDTYKTENRIQFSVLGPTEGNSFRITIEAKDKAKTTIATISTRGNIAICSVTEEGKEKPETFNGADRYDKSKARFQEILTAFLAKTPADKAETAPKEPEIPTEYLSKYNESRAKEKATRANAATTLGKAKDNLTKFPLDPKIQAIIDASIQTSNTSIKDLKGKYEENAKKTRITIGTYDTSGNLETGRVIYDNGTIAEGDFDKTTGMLTKGRAIGNNEYIYEGDFNKTNGILTKGRIIYPDGKILHGDFNKNDQTHEQGHIIYPDGRIVKKPATGEAVAPDETDRQIAELKKQIEDLYTKRNNPETTGVEANKLGDEIVKLETQVRELEEKKAAAPKAKEQKTEPAKPAPKATAPEATAEETTVKNAIKEGTDATATGKAAEIAGNTAAAAGAAEAIKVPPRTKIFDNGETFTGNPDTMSGEVTYKNGDKATGKFAANGELEEGTKTYKKPKDNIKTQTGLFDPATQEFKKGTQIFDNGSTFTGELIKGKTFKGTYKNRSNQFIGIINRNSKGKVTSRVGQNTKDGKVTNGTFNQKWETVETVDLDKIVPTDEIEDTAETLKTQAENLTTAQAEGAKLEAPTGKTITLNEKQAESIKEASTALRLELLQATNPAEIRGTLEKLATKLATATKGTEINKITFKEFDITWENKPKNQFGFETKGSFDQLINKVTKYKKEKQGADSAEFTKFRREVRAYRDLGERVEGREQQRLKYKEVSDTDYKVDKSVYELGEDGIEEKWKYIKGHGKTDKILTNKEGPFKLDKGQTGRFIAQIVTEGSNETVTLKHIFKFAAQYNKEFPQSYGDFMKKYEELGNKPSKNAAEEKEYREMFENVLSPAIELLAAISKLEYKGEKAKEKAEELSPEQKLIRTNLYEMFQYSEREPGKWEQLMGWIGGAKDEIPVMTDLNGETKYLDRGIFRRSYSPKAAYKILLETRGAYTVDEKDNRTIDQAKMLQEVNKMIRLGGMSIAMQKLMIQEKKPLEELQKDQQYKEKLQKLVPSPLGALNAPGLITKEHMEAFQLGFIISQEMKANREVEDIQRAFKEENDKAPEGQKNPMIAGMLKELEKQGVSQDDIAKVDEKLLAMGAIAFKNGKFEAAGLALNTKIAVRPGLTLTIGATASKEGVTPGAALTLSLYEGENFKAGVTGELDLGGLGLGVSASWEDVNIGIGRAKITIMVGGRIGKELMLGVGVIITRRNVGLRIAENKANIEKETGLASPGWEAFKASQGQPVEQRYALLKKVTKLYNAFVVPFEAAPFNATHEDVVYLIDSYKDKITDQAVDKIASSPWEFFHGAGLIATPYPPALMPVFVFKIGSAKVYIPNRSEIGKMRDSMSDKMMQLKLRKAVEDADKRIAASKPIERSQVQDQQQAAAEVGKEVKTDFTPADQTGKQSYSPDGRLRTRINGKTFEFAKNLAEAQETEPVEGKAPEAEKEPKTEAEKSKDFNNKLRQAVEVQLGEEKDGRRELQVLNTQNKDVEVYIDPNMDVEELGLKVEGGKLILLGNTDNLVITRERFFMPFASSKSEGNIKDIIVLRNKGSVKGEITREWIEKHSGAYAEKLEGHSGFTLEKGYGLASQANIKGEEKLTAEEEKALKEVSSKKTESAKKRQESFKTRRGEVAKTKSQIDADRKNFETRKAEKATRATEAKEMDKSTERRHKALGKIDDAQYEEQELKGPKLEQMKKLVVDPEFRNELGKVTDDDEKIKKLIITFAKKQNKSRTPKYPELQDIEKPENAKLLNAGLMKALNEWFLPLYKKGSEEDKEIHRVLEGRIRFAERILKASFEKSLNEINARLPVDKKITISAEEAAKEVTGKIYEKIREKDFKFSKLKWEGENRDIEDVETDATFFSTTRKKGGKKGEGTLTKTITYRSQMGKQGEKDLENGFIKDAIKEYDINSKDPEDKQIARLLLEMASPSPEQNIDTADKAEKFLRSPLAIKLASLETLMLVPKLGKAKFDLISGLYENIADPKKFAELFAKPEYQEALKAYKKVVQDVRNAQIEGIPYEVPFSRGNDQYVLKLTMKSSIKAGAYARCANGSFSVKEEGEVQIFKTQRPGETPPSREYPKPEKPEVPAEPIALFSESTEIVKSKQSKAILTAALGLGLKTEEEGTPPPVGGGKDTKIGSSSTEVEGGKATATGVTPDSGNTFQQVSAPKVSKLGH